MGHLAPARRSASAARHVPDAARPASQHLTRDPFALRERLGALRDLHPAQAGDRPRLSTGGPPRAEAATRGPAATVECRRRAQAQTNRVLPRTMPRPRHTNPMPPRLIPLQMSGWFPFDAPRLWRPQTMPVNRPLPTRTRPGWPHTGELRSSPRSAIRGAGHTFLRHNFFTKTPSSKNRERKSKRDWNPWHECTR